MYNNRHKKYFLVVIITLIVSFGFIDSLAAWEITSSNENEEIWEVEKKFSSIRVLNNQSVSLGGRVIESYTYTDRKMLDDHLKEEYSIEIDKENRKYYPSRFLKVVYEGYDVEGNIYLTVYYGKTGDKVMENIYNKIKTDIELGMAESEVSHSIPYSQIYNHYSDYDYDKFIVDPSKVIFFDEDIIPPLKITTNEVNSNILVEIID